MFNVKEKVIEVKTKFKDVVVSKANVVKEKAVSIAKKVFTKQNGLILLFFVLFALHPLLALWIGFLYLMDYIWFSQFKVLVEK
jgi:hypothetical protein